MKERKWEIQHGMLLKIPDLPRSRGPWRVVNIQPDGWCYLISDADPTSGGCEWKDWENTAELDTDDPATEGCLLAQVRELYGGRVSVEIGRDLGGRMAPVSVKVPSNLTISPSFFTADTLGEALMAGIEAAPEDNDET